MIRFQGVVFRAHRPRYAATPTSGVGAARHGGRFNRKGVPALYTSLDPATCLLETGHGLSKLLDPKLLVSYEVDCEDVLDLRTVAKRRAAGVEIAEMSCAWELALATGSVPDSWILSDRLIALGCAGILTPSFATNATRRNANLVLWKYGSALPHLIKEYDPGGDLPNDDSSWT